MDYQEQQSQELEALQAIYHEEELTVINEEYPDISLAFDVKSNQDGDEDENSFSICMRIQLPETYPDVIPKIELEDDEELFSEERLEKLVEMLNNVAEENLGMVMVFTIVSAMQEEIATLVDERKEQAQLRVEEAMKKEDEKTKRKFQGTAVTPESFLDWKLKFDEQRAILKDQRQKEREAALAGRLTGRQMFLRDATLNLSDVAIIGEGDVKNVEIDESLFEDEELDGLDELSDDE